MGRADSPFRFQQDVLGRVSLLPELLTLHDEVHILCSSSPNLSHGERLHKSSASLQPHYRELMPEEFGGLIQPGSEERWESQQVYGAKSAQEISLVNFPVESPPLDIHSHRHLDP